MTAERPTAGLWLVHKPEGATSFSLVRDFQQRLAAVPGKALKVCHGGALDPFAQGLVPVLVGSATKVFEWLHDAPKHYRATIGWGRETDNSDLHGQTVATGEVAGLTPARIEQAIGALVGWSEQVPPSTSNKRVDGERAYVRAHRGEVFELPPSRVYLHHAQLVNEKTVDLVCRGGFYVRSFVRDLGRSLGVPAHVERLERTAIGPWLDSSEPRRIESTKVLPWLPARRVSDAEWGQLRAGQPISRGELSTDWPLPVGFPPARPQVRALHLGALVALLDVQENEGTLKLAVDLPGLR